MTPNNARSPKHKPKIKTMNTNKKAQLAIQGRATLPGFRFFMIIESAGRHVEATPSTGSNR